MPRQDSELAQKLNVVNELVKDDQITRHGHYHESKALETIHGDIPTSKACVICLRDDGKRKWGEIKRYEDEKNKRGAHYFCKEHRDCEMPKFCPKCKSPLVEMKTNYFCYECSKLIPKQKTKIAKKEPKKIARVKKIISPEEDSLEVKLLKCLKSGAKNRENLVDELKRARTTIYDNLMKLKRKGLIEARSRKIPSVRGRPKTYWSIINDDAVKIYMSRTRKDDKPTKKIKHVPCPIDPKCWGYDAEIGCVLHEKGHFTLCGGFTDKNDEKPVEKPSIGSKSQIKNKKGGQTNV